MLRTVLHLEVCITFLGASSLKVRFLVFSEQMNIFKNPEESFSLNASDMHVNCCLLIKTFHVSSIIMDPHISSLIDKEYSTQQRQVTLSEPFEIDEIMHQCT